MDDSFKSRVEKIFGSLTAPPPQQPPSIRSNLWSLTDDEVEKREWRRGDAAASDRDEMPCSSSFDEFKKNRRRSFRRVRGDDVGEVEEEEEEEEESDSLRRRGVKADDVDEWDIRSSIGLDRTLDNEEEEDEYDKVASGRDNGGRIYMSSINNQEAYLNIHNVIPDASYGRKDRRANYMAAKIRLREDDNEARNLTSTHDDKKENRELEAKSSHISASEFRSILKRKDRSSDSRSNKRVRFDPSCNIVSKEESYDKTQAMSMDSSSCNNSMADNENMGTRNVNGVPDYLRNPSKYTCYSFDSSADVEEKSNPQNCMDILNMVKFIKSSDFEGASSHLPQSVAFVPKKKGVEPGAVNKVKQDENGPSLKQTGLAIGIAAGDAQESEPDAMEEDEPGTDTLIRSASTEKTSRRYRMKSGSEESTP